MRLLALCLALLLAGCGRRSPHSLPPTAPLRARAFPAMMGPMPPPPRHEGIAMTSAALVSLLFLVPLQAPDLKPSPADTLRALKEQYEQFTTQWTKDLEQVDDGGREKLLEARRKEGQAAAQRALKLAHDYPDDPVAFDALEWVITGGLGPYPETWQALNSVTERHLTSPKLSLICRHARSFRSGSFDTEAFLRSVLAKNPHREVQGYACVNLAGLLAAGAESAARLREAEALYQRTIDQYGDIRSEGRRQSLGQWAAATLYRLRHLQPGKLAPEIEGEDIDGKRFKLSDYRGKVVVLNFWGHW